MKPKVLAFLILAPFLVLAACGADPLARAVVERSFIDQEEAANLAAAHWIPPGGVGGVGPLTLKVRGARWTSAGPAEKLDPGSRWLAVDLDLTNGGKDPLDLLEVLRFELHSQLPSERKVYRVEAVELRKGTPWLLAPQKTFRATLTFEADPQASSWLLVVAPRGFSPMVVSLKPNGVP